MNASLLPHLLVLLSVLLCVSAYPFSRYSEIPLPALMEGPFVESIVSPGSGVKSSYNGHVFYNRAIESRRINYKPQPEIGFFCRKSNSDFSLGCSQIDTNGFSYMLYHSDRSCCTCCSSQTSLTRQCGWSLESLKTLRYQRDAKAFEFQIPAENPFSVSSSVGADTDVQLYKGVFGNELDAYGSPSLLVATKTKKPVYFNEAVFVFKEFTQEHLKINEETRFAADPKTYALPDWCTPEKRQAMCEESCEPFF